MPPPVHNELLQMSATGGKHSPALYPSLDGHSRIAAASPGATDRALRLDKLKQFGEAMSSGSSSSNGGGNSNYTTRLDGSTATTPAATPSGTSRTASFGRTLSSENTNSTSGVSAKVAVVRGVVQRRNSSGGGVAPLSLGAAVGAGGPKSMASSAEALLRRTSPYRLSDIVHGGSGNTGRVHSLTTVAVITAIFVAITLGTTILVAAVCCRHSRARCRARQRRRKNHCTGIGVSGGSGYGGTGNADLVHCGGGERAGSRYDCEMNEFHDGCRSDDDDMTSDNGSAAASNYSLSSAASMHRKSRSGANRLLTDSRMDLLNADACSTSYSLRPSDDDPATLYGGGSAIDVETTSTLPADDVIKHSNSAVVDLNQRPSQVPANTEIEAVYSSGSCDSDFSNDDDDDFEANEPTRGGRLSSVFRSRPSKCNDGVGGEYRRLSTKSRRATLPARGHNVGEQQTPTCYTVSRSVPTTNIFKH